MFHKSLAYKSGEVYQSLMLKHNFSPYEYIL